MKENLFEKHPPRIVYDTIGFPNYDNLSSIICLCAVDKKNFNDYGIVDNSILFVQRALEFEEGKLNVFKSDGKEAFMLSKEKEALEYIGRVVFSANLYS